MDKKEERIFNMTILTLLGPTPTEWMNTNNPSVSINLKVPPKVKEYLERFHAEFSETSSGNLFDLLFTELVIVGLKREAERLIKEGIYIDLLTGGVEQQDGVPDISDFL